MMSDLRQAWRIIRRMPGLATVVIVSVGVGIGVNTAVFSWIQAMVLQPIPGVVDASGVQLVEARARADRIQACRGPSTAIYTIACTRFPTSSPIEWSRSTSARAVEPSGRMACSSRQTTSPRSV
jgi:hypothetical protein